MELVEENMELVEENVELVEENGEVVGQLWERTSTTAKCATS